MSPTLLPPPAVAARPDFAALLRQRPTVFAPAPLPDDFAQRTQGAITLEARFYTGAPGELRSVHIRSPRAEIFNLFFFPAAARALPVYVLEVVIFGERPVVGVLDLHALESSPACARFARATLAEAHAAFPGLHPADDAPAWYAECRSGQDFFVRPASLAGLEELAACHRQVWARLAPLLSAAPAVDPPTAGRQADALRRYKAHHRAHSPGLPFLQRTFGESWTGRFLGEALFA